MKKAFDQTFRDIKRGVNKKVLKVPSIEQKVLDATSNEPWGPHGTHLADIAQASRNYHEYQMVMPIVWKRLSDSGKNWRHVYKALTILEYLVANGSERVIEDIREHAYQITALSSFQYIDSTGRDQGSNVRKKSQSLVALVMDKEKIQEARDKATVSRDKYRNTPGDEGRYGNNREEDRNGYGREREWDDEYGGRSTSNDGDHGPRSRSSDREREDDGHRSSRGSNARVEDASPDVSRVEPKASGQNVGAPPSYEDAVIGGGSPVGVKRDGETAPAAAASPQVNINHQETAAPPPPAVAAMPPPPTAVTTTTNNENEVFDLFDPRGATAFSGAAAPAPPPASGGAENEMDLLSDSFSSNALALVPSTTTTEIHAPAYSNPYLTFDTPLPPVSSQPFDNPFGDGPFKATPSTTDGFSATSPFGTSVEPSTISVDPMSGGFGEAFDPTVDILADILPPPSQTTAFQPQPGPLSTHTLLPSQTPEPPNQSYSTPFGEPPSFSSQAMPQSAALQAPGGHQSMPQSALQVSASHHQYRSLPDFQVQGGHQSMPQPASQVSSGHQSMPPQSAFQVSNGHQSVPQSASQVQGGQQSMPQSALQSIIPQPSYPGQAGQSVLQPGFPAPQNASVGGFSSQLGSQGFPTSNGQPVSQPGLPAQGGQNAAAALGGFSPQLGGGVSQAAGLPSSSGRSMLQPGFLGQGSQSGFPTQGGQHAAAALGHLGTGFPTSNGQAGHPNNLYGGFQPQTSSASVPPLSTPVPQYNNTSNFYQQQQQQPGLTASSGALALVVPPPPPQQPAAADKKFETKSTVWADTLNRGLVNLNISGAKTNPLSDIGIDFEAINRKEKRMEKPSTTPVTSNVSMGKAMGSGSGMGRAGAGVLRPAPNPMMAGPAYGGGMGINHMPHNMGIGMGMGMGTGMAQMQQQPGFPPGPGNYNPMMGRGVGYGQQQPYGGAYR